MDTLHTEEMETKINHNVPNETFPINIKDNELLKFYDAKFLLFSNFTFCRFLQIVEQVVSAVFEDLVRNK